MIVEGGLQDEAVGFALKTISGVDQVCLVRTVARYDAGERRKGAGGLSAGGYVKVM